MGTHKDKLIEGLKKPEQLKLTADDINTILEEQTDEIFNCNLDLNDYEVKDKMIMLKYRKNVLPVYQFPSTDKINDKYYLNKIVFKITNLIYLNFEIKKKSDVEKYYRVYINFNNDRKNIDRDVIIKNIELTLSNLKKILN